MQSSSSQAWLRPRRLDYVALGDHLAVVRLLAATTPEAPSWREFDLRAAIGPEQLSHPALGAVAHHRRPRAGSGLAGRRRAAHQDASVLWRVTFAAQLEVVEEPAAFFALVVDGRAPVWLPAPSPCTIAGLSEPWPAAPWAKAMVGAVAWRRLVALGAAAGLAGSTVAPAAVAAAVRPVVSAPAASSDATASSDTTTTSHTSTAPDTSTAPASSTPNAAPAPAHEPVPAVHPIVHVSPPPPPQPTAAKGVTEPSPAPPKTITPSPAAHAPVPVPSPPAPAHAPIPVPSSPVTLPSAPTPPTTTTTVAAPTTILPTTSISAGTPAATAAPSVSVPSTGHLTQAPPSMLPVIKGRVGLPNYQGLQDQPAGAGKGNRQARGRNGKAQLKDSGGVSPFAAVPTPQPASAPLPPAETQTISSTGIPSGESDSAFTGPGGSSSAVLTPIAGGSEYQPPSYLIRIYKQAGQRYQVPWEVLAAINSIETDYGRDLSVSSAGAIGWMQFMPGTWAEYAVSASGHGTPNPYNPSDAIFTAAHYLAASGAAHDLRGAIFAYNHASWYVDEVMQRAGMIKAMSGGPGGTPVGVALAPGGQVKAPRNAPPAVARAIAAGNAIATLPYIWGGGHASFQASGYDCSGSVSYALAAAGLLSAPLVSGDLESWGVPGPGRWITVYANATHAWMVIAGWRFDTVALAETGTRWSSTMADTSGFVVRHYPGL